jgi:SAM-dependent methyltransferase
MPNFINWIPTQPECIDAFFDLAPMSSSDVVYDLGCGDGRLLFMALQKGAGKCIGIDIDSELIIHAKETAINKCLDKQVTFIISDVLSADLSQASVILCYLYPTAFAALRLKLEKELKPGTRIVMESFPMPGWKPVKVDNSANRNFYLYIMPVKKTEDYDYAINNINLLTSGIDISKYNDYAESIKAVK